MHNHLQRSLNRKASVRNNVVSSVIGAAIKSIFRRTWFFAYPSFPVLCLMALMLWANQNAVVKTMREEAVKQMTTKTMLLQCEGTGKGSGFFIDKEHFFTAYHVIEHCEPEKLLVAQSMRVDSVAYADRGSDSALLKVKTDDFNAPIVDIDCALPHFEQRVVMAGFPLSATERVKTIDGQIVMPYWFGLPDETGKELIPKFSAIVDSEVFQGMSGGPVFDRDTGKVFGWNIYVATPNSQLTKYAGVGLFYDVCSIVKDKNVIAQQPDVTTGQ